MADLDEMLLEAAGRTGRKCHSPPPSRRRHKGSYSDDGTDSGDNSDGNRGYANRKKPSASQVLLKKRLDQSSDQEDEQSSREDEGYDRDSDDDSIGSDLYKGEEDRQRLAKMSELEREMILAERASKKNDKDLKNSIKKLKENTKITHHHHHQSRKDSSPPPPQTVLRSVRSSTRSADRTAAKDGALNELRARQRLRQQDLAVRGSSNSGRGYDSLGKRRSFTSLALNTSRSSDSESRSEDEESMGDGGMADSDDDKAVKESSVLTFDYVKEITIKRTKLAKWLMEPFFEELIVGCFVRVGIGRSRSGPIYRLCIVRSVDAADPDKPYNLENKMTYKYLNVIWGNENSAARWQMALVSNSPPLKEEFDQLVREVERTGGKMPSRQDVLEKHEAIERTNSFVYSAEMVKQMLQEKKSATRRPLNVAAEKDRLRREMDAAQTKQDEAEVEKIKVRLQELEASRQTQVKDAKAIRLAEMNRRNRAENFRNASELKPVNTDLRAGEAGYDPFSRRWTRSRNYYVSKPTSDGSKSDAGPSSDEPGEASMGMVATVAALEAAADAGKLVDTRAPVDQGTDETNALHDFDLPISLAILQRFGGSHGVQAGFMAHKQRIEAAVGYRVPESDGRRHTLTLTVGDYKRRRGLL